MVSGLTILETLNHLECTSRTKNGDTVGIHYTGYLSDGTKFDSSHDRNVPLYFEIGRGQMIQGWEKGVLDMCPGEKRKLLIPPELGYGERGIGPIPPNSDLTFDIELVEVLNLRDEL